ncbi:excisionase family DNA-binding protein [Nocardia lijiangensis]|uniref:excisionase family DNA-binding protein n=1 Tax=Nocardia lijiangensis TaxID=299618 RepID=UPI003D740BEC
MPQTSRSKNRSAQIKSRYVSIKFAAERASVSKDTIRRMIADGTLPAYRFRGQIRQQSHASAALKDRARSSRSTALAPHSPKRLCPTLRSKQLHTCIDVTRATLDDVDRGWSGQSRARKLSHAYCTQISTILSK